LCAPLLSPYALHAPHISFCSILSPEQSDACTLGFYKAMEVLPEDSTIVPKHVVQMTNWKNIRSRWVTNTYITCCCSCKSFRSACDRCLGSVRKFDQGPIYLPTNLPKPPCHSSLPARSH
jgi:hypothetical protein